jgi:hypothetical protein
MPLFPVKDRTISLTMESDLPQQGEVQSQLSKYAKNFAQKFIPSTGPAGAAANALGLASKTLKLVGPAYMNFDFDAAVAEEPGPFTSHLQGWYIRPVVVSIKGESYLGTYTGVSRSDGDIKKLLEKFKQQLTDFTPRYGTPGTQERVQIEIANNPPGSRKFFGYIKHLSFSEAITSPYLLPYDLTFIGRNVDNLQIAQGSAYGAQALKQAGDS